MFTKKVIQLFAIFSCLFFLMACEESSQDVKSGGGSGGSGGRQNKLSVPNSKNLRLAVFSLDNYGEVSGSRQGKNLKNILFERFQKDIDVIVFTGVISPALLEKEVAHAKFKCETFSSLEEIRGFQYIVVCRHPELVKFVEGEGLPTRDLRKNRISGVRHKDFPEFPPAFQAVYEFKKDGFRFYLIAVDLISRQRNEEKRAMQVEALRRYIDKKVPKNLPVAIIGNWNNTPQEDTSDENKLEIETFLEELQKVHTDIDFVGTEEERTMVYNTDFEPTDLPKRYNNLFFTSEDWSVKEGISYNVCGNTEKSKNKNGEIEKDKKNYAENVSRHCWVWFELKKRN